MRFADHPTAAIVGNCCRRAAETGIVEESDASAGESKVEALGEHTRVLEVEPLSEPIERNTLQLDVAIQADPPRSRPIEEGRGRLLLAATRAPGLFVIVHSIAPPDSTGRDQSRRD
jgi:hypothetical protein